MTITKQIVIDEITITDNNIVLLREATRILEDDVLLTQTYHRTSLVPGQDILEQPKKVQDICNLIWTDEVVETYRNNLEQQRLQP